MSKYYIQYNQNTQNDQHNTSTVALPTSTTNCAAIATDPHDTKSINSGQYANNSYRHHTNTSSDATNGITAKLEQVNSAPSSQLKMNSHLLDHGYGATPQPSYPSKVVGKSSELTNYYKVRKFYRFHLVFSLSFFFVCFVFEHCFVLSIFYFLCVLRSWSMRDRTRSYCQCVF